MKLKKYILSLLFFFIQNNKMMQEATFNVTDAHLQFFKKTFDDMLKKNFPTETLTIEKFFNEINKEEFQSYEYFSHKTKNNLIKFLKQLTDYNYTNYIRLLEYAQAKDINPILFMKSIDYKSKHLLLTEFICSIIEHLNNNENDNNLSKKLEKLIVSNNQKNNKFKIITSFFNTKFFFISTVFNIAFLFFCWKFKKKQLLNNTVKDIITNTFITVSMFIAPIIVYFTAIFLHIQKIHLDFPNEQIKRYVHILAPVFKDFFLKK